MNAKKTLRSGNVLCHTIDGETVVLNLDNEKYFTFDAVATRFWEVVLEHGCGDAAIEILLKEYEVDRGTLVSDMERWVQESIELGLLVRAASSE